MRGVTIVSCHKQRARDALAPQVPCLDDLGARVVPPVHSSSGSTRPHGCFGTREYSDKRLPDTNHLRAVRERKIGDFHEKQSKVIRSLQI